MKLNNILANAKKYLMYIIFLGITFIVTLSLFIWSATEKAASTIEIIHQATVVTTEGTVTEYLAGEKVTTDGVKLQLADGRVIGEGSYTVEADLSTAGKKAVSIIFTEDGEKHIGKYPVDVFAIRHFDLRSYPRVLNKTNNGYAFNDFVLWAELSGIPTTGRFTVNPEHPDWTNTVVIANDMYQITVDETGDSDVKTARVQVGVRDLSFNFYSVDGSLNTSNVANSVTMMQLTNKTENSTDTLTLFVNTKETNQNDGENGATGYYLLKHVSGGSVSYKYYQFSYYIDSGWASHFSSNAFNEGLTESFVAGAGAYPYTVKIAADKNPSGVEMTFEANGDAWRSAFIAV